MVVVLVECEFSRIGRKGCAFYIQRLANKIFSTCSLTVKDNDSLLKSTRITLASSILLVLHTFKSFIRANDFLLTVQHFLLLDPFGTAATSLRHCLPA